MIFAGVLLSAGLVCLVLVKRHRKVLGGSLIVGAVTLGSLIGTEPANADLGVPFNPPSKRQPVRKVADVLGNQVGIELTDGCSVMLLLGDDYHVTGKESFAPKKMQTNGFGARPNGAADGIVPGRGQLVPAADATIIRGIPER